MNRFSYLVNVGAICGLIVFCGALVPKADTVTGPPAPWWQVNRLGHVPTDRHEMRNKTFQFECIKWAASKGKDGQDVHDRNWLCLYYTGQSF